MFHSSSILRSFPLRAETTVDLSGSSMLPFPNVPCSLTPPQSPVTIASCGDLLLPSSQYDAVGLRFTIITRLNRFTCVTTRSSLVPTLNSCRCLHEPKARFPVGRLIPLSEAGISPAGSIRLFLTHHIGDAICPGLAPAEYGRRPLRRGLPANPCSTRGAFGFDCNRLRKFEVDSEDAARQIRRHGQGSPVGSSRSASHNSHSAMAIAARLAGPECPSPEDAG